MNKIDENTRLNVLKSYDILDTEPQQIYDDITLIASQICKVPIALISLIDENRQWFKSKIGLEATETPREYAFCSHAIENPSELFIIKDALEDSRFNSNPLVIDNPHIRFYAGAPLVTPDGFALGTLCVIDQVPRELSDEQLNALAALQRNVVTAFELRKSLKEIKLAKDALTKSEAQLREINATKDRFFSIIAHDLKNPLGSFKEITNYLAESYNDFSEADKIEFLNLMKDSSQNLYALLENLLEWSSSQRGSIQFDPTDLNLYLLSKDVVNLLKPTADKKKIAIQNDFNPSIMLYADSNMLNTVLRNLISNAIKFTPEQGTIKLNAAMEQEKCVISVSDSGLGMTAETIEKLFKIDSQLTTLGTNKEKGTGLGLILCKEFVEKHGGKIWVKSELGKGSTFYFTLPSI